MGLARTMKNNPRPLFLLHQTLQLALCIWAGSSSHGIRQTQISPSNCQMVWCDSSLQRMRFRCSRVQWRRALHHSHLRLVLRIVILCLCAVARPWKPISWSFQRTVLVLTLLPEAVWNSVVSVATEDRWFWCTTAPGSPVLWACVAYHFAAEPLLLLDISTSQ